MFGPFRWFYRSPYKSPYRSPCGSPSSRPDCNPFGEHASRNSERISLLHVVRMNSSSFSIKNSARFILATKRVAGKVFRNRRRAKNRKFRSNTFCPSCWMKRFLAFTKNFSILESQPQLLKKFQFLHQKLSFHFQVG